MAINSKLTIHQHIENKSTHSETTEHLYHTPIPKSQISIREQERPEELKMVNNCCETVPSRYDKHYI